MSIDPMLIAVIAGPILGGIAGIWLDRVLSSPKLVYFLGHASRFAIRAPDAPPDAPPVVIHTHSVVIRNAGRSAAHNVRLAHNVLPPNVDISPPREHRIDAAQNEICIALMVPSDIIAVSYLYLPPLFWNQTNTTVRSDEGFGTAIPVLPVRQYSKRFTRTFAATVIIGWMALIYLLASLGIQLWRTYLSGGAP